MSKTIYDDLISSGTAYFPEYIEEHFQVTINETIDGIRHSYYPAQFSQGQNIQERDLLTQTFIIIDGEFRVLDEGPPPGLVPLENNAAILNIEEY